MYVFSNGRILPGFRILLLSWVIFLVSLAVFVYAENWTDPESLDSHFGKCVYFEGDEEKFWGELSVRYYELEAEGDTDSVASLNFPGLDEEKRLTGSEYRI
ncbi:MAG: hypothetical protein K5929_08960 [Lachnospiraceae bacterium]|nr:hypothetical protein [Lachnospiraceae bacterium]